jgi:hypothetical protein
MYYSFGCIPWGCEYRRVIPYLAIFQLCKWKNPIKLYQVQLATSGNRIPNARERLIDFWCFNATFGNISAISWRPVLVVKEAGVLGENHRPWTSNW